MANLDYHQLLEQVREEKKAEEMPISAAAKNAVVGSLHQQALDDIKKVSLLGLGLGAAARGGTGIYNLLRRNLQPRKLHDSFVPVPVPVRGEEEEEPKMALDSFMGQPISQKESVGYYLPGMMLGGLAATYGGWKGVDALLDARRQESVEAELEQQRAKFRRALLGQENKEAGDAESDELVKLSEDLDRLFDTLEEKQAAGLADYVSQGLQGYTTYALASAPLAAYAAYQVGKKNQRRSIIEKALKQRRRRRFMQQPTPLYAEPVEDEQNVETANIA